VSTEAQDSNAFRRSGLQGNPSPPPHKARHLSPGRRGEVRKEDNHDAKREQTDWRKENMLTILSTKTRHQTKMFRGLNRGGGKSKL